jgi:integrase/recombinase XerD
MKLSKAVDGFVKEHETRGAKATASAYGSDLHYLVTLARPDSVMAFDDDLCWAYFTALSSQGQKMSTLHRKAAALSQFAKWGIRKGLWLSNPLDDPKYTFKRPDPEPKPFDEDESKALMGLPLTGAEKVFRGLLYYTGLRVSPICNLRACDVTLSVTGAIRATSKGGRYQSIPVAEPLRVVLGEWLADNPRKSYDPLVSYPSGKPYSRRAVERMCHQWGLAAGVTNCIPHRFRHTLATDLLRQGRDIRVIQKCLGHADIKSTLVYTKVSDAQLEEAFLGR